ncbi:unnamed protein product, partial [Brachionus calyciflorus]
RNLDIFCADAKKTLDQRINCEVRAFTTNKEDKIEIEFEEDENYIIKDISNSQISYFGSYDSLKKISRIIQNSQTGNFLLPSTEVRFDTNLIGFEIFAFKAGTINLKFVRFNNCGNDSCSNAIFESSPSYVQAREGSLITETLVKGYNRILYSPRSIKKGDILMIIDSNNILAVNDTNDFTIMGDFYINGTISKKLNRSENWRFYVNLLIDTKFFISCFSVGKSYFNIKNENFGVYSIEASFLNTSVQLEREFTITKYRTIDMFCSDTNRTINNTINCAIIAATQSRNDTILVDGTQYSFSGDAISYFGAKVPQNITNPVAFIESGYYLLPLTEAKFDAKVIGFEGYALGIGTYNTYLANINSTYQKESCENSTLDSDLSSEVFSDLEIADFQSVYGHNIYYLKTPIKILKGQMLAIKFNFPVAIDTSNDYLMSDYRMTCGQSLKLNIKHNWRIYFNWIIEQKYYLNYFYFAKTYNLGGNSIFGVYNLTASFLDANTTVTRTVNISNSK